MRFVTGGLIAAGLGTWLTASGVRPSQDGPDRQPEDGQAEPCLLAEANGHSDEMVPADPPPGHHPRGEMGERPRWGRRGDPQGRPGFGRKFGRHDGEPLTGEQIDRLMEFTREHFPKIHERLSRVRTSHHPAFQKMVRRVHGHVGMIMELEIDRPDLAGKMIQAMQVEMELTELQKEYRGVASAEQRDQVKRRMREQLDTRFDLRLERLRFEINELEKRLEETKRHLAERESNKDGIIDKDLERLIAGKPLERGGPPGPHGPLMRKRDMLPPSPPPPPPER